MRLRMARGGREAPVMFFVGMHQPCDAWRVPAAFISVHRLKARRSGFRVRRWVMDSGAFRTIELHGGYPDPPDDYAAHIRRFAGNGQLLAAVAQDYMCEPHMLARTGLTIADHQRMTVERYDGLLSCDTGGVYVMPVLQGYAPQDYIAHIRLYGERLKHRMWVGVGSVCKRNSDPVAIENVLLAISRERPDLRLHGFGIKTTSLSSGIVRQLLFSADSMAWSFAARMAGKNANDAREAVAFCERVQAQEPAPSLLTGMIASEFRPGRQQRRGGSRR